MAERIEVLFEGGDSMDPRNIVLDSSPDPHTARGRGLDAAFAKLL